MSINILLVGCCGGMGKTITAQISADDRYEIVAGIDNNSNISSNYPIYSNFKNINEEIHVIVDFSNRELLTQILEFASVKKTPVILATTGYMESDLDTILETSKLIPIFRSANMSYGINVMIKLLKKAALLLEEDYNIEIVEKHHKLKKDSPSGTAKMIANAMNESIMDKCEFVYGRKGNDTRRKENEIGIHAIRGGTLSGEHTVIFAGNDEVIEIKHEAMSKRVFATGALKAVDFIIGKDYGLYNMDSML